MAVNSQRTIKEKLLLLNMSENASEEQESKRQRARESLLSGGERVSKGRQRTKQDE